MLCRLTVENYALIDRLDIEFAAGLNIITGETGAGKSILLGALGLVLGARADAAAIKDSGRNASSRPSSTSGVTAWSRCSGRSMWTMTSGPSCGG